MVFKVIIHLELALSSSQPTLSLFPEYFFPKCLHDWIFHIIQGFAEVICLADFPYHPMKNSPSCPSLSVLSSRSGFFSFQHSSLPGALCICSLLHCLSPLEGMLHEDTGLIKYLAQCSIPST